MANHLKALQPSSFTHRYFEEFHMKSKTAANIAIFTTECGMSQSSSHIDNAPKVSLEIQGELEMTERELQRYMEKRFNKIFIENSART